MTKIVSLPSIALCLLALSTALPLRAADDPQVEKKKIYTKTYSVSANDNVSITNKFGEVTVMPSTNNEVKVDVTITVKSTTDERAQEILDNISIEDNKNAEGVSFKTNMKDNDRKKKDNKNYKDEKMEINYQVHMPVSNPLTLNNEFGATIVPDMQGLVNINSKFGSLTAGKLSNVKKVNVEFGSATIDNINNGSLVIKFSRAIINKLDGSVEAVFEHASGIKIGIENSAKQLRITSSFSTLFVDINKNFGATYAISTSFGELSNKTDFDIKDDSKSEHHGQNFNHNYTGKSGNGNTSIKIGSSFSNITIGHDLTMDLKDKKKTVI